MPATKEETPRHPDPKQVVAIRESYQEYANTGITKAQEYCATQLHTGLRTWQQWERGERKMHPAFWELINIKIKRGSV